MLKWLPTLQPTYSWMEKFFWQFRCHLRYSELRHQNLFAVFFRVFLWEACTVLLFAYLHNLRIISITFLKLSTRKHQNLAGYMLSTPVYGVGGHRSVFPCTPVLCSTHCQRRCSHADLRQSKGAGLTVLLHHGFCETPPEILKMWYHLVIWIIILVQAHHGIIFLKHLYFLL